MYGIIRTSTRLTFNLSYSDYTISVSSLLSSKSLYIVYLNFYATLINYTYTPTNLLFITS